MKNPTTVELKKETAKILSQTLLASLPNEGCALLIGNNEESKDIKNEIRMKIKLIWPCYNIWEATKEPHKEVLIRSRPPKLSNCSKQNRFQIDPREQIYAQKWARARNLKILGSAHSHPFTDAVPSVIDISMNSSSNLIIIIGNSEEMRAWWITSTQKVKELQIAFLI